MIGLWSRWYSLTAGGFRTGAPDVTPIPRPVRMAPHATAEDVDRPLHLTAPRVGPSGCQADDDRYHCRGYPGILVTDLLERP